MCIIDAYFFLLDRYVLQLGRLGLKTIGSTKWGSNNLDGPLGVGSSANQTFVGRLCRNVWRFLNALKEKNVGNLIKIGCENSLKF